MTDIPADVLEAYRTREWPAERSVLALGLDPETSKEIGRLFEQNAICLVVKRSSSGLILLR